MLLAIPEVLRPEQAAQLYQALLRAEWEDGRATAGYQSAKAKNNWQLPATSPLAEQLGDLICEALQSNALFLSAALPFRIFPPLFNRYDGGQAFGTHVDNAIRQVPGTNHRIRTDLSATLFLSPVESYDGGELVIEDTYGTHEVKLPPGHLVLYPATSLHHVKPVTRGSRISSFFWLQSMVRHDGQRSLLFDMDVAIQGLAQSAPDHPSAVQLTGVYHNLVRMWAEL